MSNNRQKRIIHTIAYRALGMTKEQYKTTLYGAMGVHSSKDLTVQQADDFIEVLNGMKEDGAGDDLTVFEQMERAEEIDWGWGKEKYERLASRPAEWARPRQLRKIEAMWRDVARDRRDPALWSFLERQTGERHPARLKAEQVRPVLIALKEMKNSGGEAEEDSSKPDRTGDERASKGVRKATPERAAQEPPRTARPLGTDRALPRPPAAIAEWTHEERVLWHLRHVGPLTQLEAQQLYGVARLSARILNLRSEGHRIETEHRTVKSRFGSDATIGVYVLHEEND